MKTFLLCLIAAAFFGSAHHATAQSLDYKETHIVGTQPLTTIYDPASGYHIICGGRDVNFDGVYAPGDGDVLPSWWKFEGIAAPTVGTPYPTGLTKVRDLDFGSMGFPFRPGVRRGIDEQYSSGILYISQNGRVKAYAFYNGELLNDTVVNVSASSVYYDDNKLFLSIRNQDSDDLVVIYNISEDKFTDTLIAGINVQQVIKFAYSGQEFLAVLNEGGFGTETSTLQIFELSDSKYTLNTSIDIGNGGNHIAVNDDLMAVTVNGSKQVILIDIPDFTINKIIPFLSGGAYDGPRESVITDNQIYTSSYEGKVFIINPNTGEITGDLESDGKSEGLLFSQGVLFAANPFVTGGYDQDSTVTTWSTVSSVESQNVIKELNIYPNPVGEVLSLSTSFENSIGGDFQFQISDLNGRIIYTQNFIADGDEFQMRFDISNLGITSGSYYAIIKNNRYLRAIPFVKMK